MITAHGLQNQGLAHVLYSGAVLPTCGGVPERPSGGIESGDGPACGVCRRGEKATKDQTPGGQKHGMMMSVVCRGVGNLPRWPCTVQSITHDYDAGPRGATARHSTSRAWHLGQCACTMQPFPALARHGISATSPYCVKYWLSDICTVLY